MSHEDKSHKESDAPMHPHAPSQKELDADRAANPDTSEEQSKDGGGAA